MTIKIIQVPYDSGTYNVRMGQGPYAFSKGGIEERLMRACGDVETAVIQEHEQFPREIGTTFKTIRRVSDEVRRTVSKGQFPLVLSGNCISSVGAVSGLKPAAIGLIWFDAHGDFHTPETSTSGFLDAMALSITVGHCWEAISETIPGYLPLRESQVILVGGRDFEVEEHRRLKESNINHLECGRIHENLEEVVLNSLRLLPDSIEQVYFHIDLDVHDPELAPANHYKPEGGLSPDEVIEIVSIIGGWMPVAGATLAAYDPGADPEGTCLSVGLSLAEQIGRLGAGR